MLLLPERDQGLGEAVMEVMFVVEVRWWDGAGGGVSSGGWFVAVCQGVISAVHSARVSRGTLVSS